MSPEYLFAKLPDTIDGHYVKLVVQWFGKTKSHVMCSMVVESNTDPKPQSWHPDFDSDDYEANTLLDGLFELLTYLQQEGLAEL